MLYQFITSELESDDQIQDFHLPHRKQRDYITVFVMAQLYQYRVCECSGAHAPLHIQGFQKKRLMLKYSLKKTK